MRTARLQAGSVRTHTHQNETMQSGTNQFTVVSSYLKDNPVRIAETRESSDNMLVAKAPGGMDGGSGFVFAREPTTKPIYCASRCLHLDA